jgi:hypothetical protein
MDRDQGHDRMDASLTPQQQEAIELELASFAGAMVDESSELSQLLEERHGMLEAACERIVPEALAHGFTPDDMFIGLVDTDSALAMMVRRRLRVELLRRSHGAEFDARAEEISRSHPATSTARLSSRRWTTSARFAVYLRPRLAPHVPQRKKPTGRTSHYEHNPCWIKWPPDSMR